LSGALDLKATSLCKPDIMMIMNMCSSAITQLVFHAMD
jgi:hypothetical protein